MTTALEHHIESILPHLLQVEGSDNAVNAARLAAESLLLFLDVATAGSHLPIDNQD